MKANDTYSSRELRFSLGIDEHSKFYYVSFPVTIGIADWAEYYKLTDEQYEQFLADPVAAVPFVNECRRWEHDVLLLVKPGVPRGIGN